MPTIAELLARSRDLQPLSDSARLDTELLLGHVLDCERGYLFTWPDRAVSAVQNHQFETLLARRRQGEPVAHILGHRAFWTFELAVSPATLIPRPETELLVELSLQLMPVETGRVIDLGTGTGAVALALASERPGWQVLAVDNSEAAVNLAKHNRQRLGLANVEVRLGDWLQNTGAGFDLVVSNPPYIAAGDEHLVRGDLRFEPASALVAGRDGMAAIATIVGTAPGSLVPGGWLLLEHGADQGPGTRRLLLSAGYDQVSTRQDLAGLDRVTLARWQGNSGGDSTGKPGEGG